MAVALAALDATVEVESTRGTRRIPVTEFHRLPGATPHLETRWSADELITAVELPVLPVAAIPATERCATGSPMPSRWCRSPRRWMSEPTASSCGPVGAGRGRDQAVAGVPGGAGPARRAGNGGDVPPGRRGRTRFCHRTSGQHLQDRPGQAHDRGDTAAAARRRDRRMTGIGRACGRPAALIAGRRQGEDHRRGAVRRGVPLPRHGPRRTGARHRGPREDHAYRVRCRGSHTGCHRHHHPPNAPKTKPPRKPSMAGIWVRVSRAHKSIT